MNGAMYMPLREVFVTSRRLIQLGNIRFVGLEQFLQALAVALLICSSLGLVFGFFNADVLQGTLVLIWFAWLIWLIPFTRTASLLAADKNFALIPRWRSAIRRTVGLHTAVFWTTTALGLGLMNGLPGLNAALYYALVYLALPPAQKLNFGFLLISWDKHLPKAVYDVWLSIMATPWTTAALALALVALLGYAGNGDWPTLRTSDGRAGWGGRLRPAGWWWRSATRHQVARRDPQRLLLRVLGPAHLTRMIGVALASMLVLAYVPPAALKPSLPNGLVIALLGAWMGVYAYGLLALRRSRAATRFEQSVLRLVPGMPCGAHFERVLLEAMTREWLLAFAGVALLVCVAAFAWLGPTAPWMALTLWLPFSVGVHMLDVKDPKAIIQFDRSDLLWVLPLFIDALNVLLSMRPLQFDWMTLAFANLVLAGAMVYPAVKR